MEFMEESTDQVTEGPIREFILFSTGIGEPLKVFLKGQWHIYIIYTDFSSSVVGDTVERVNTEGKRNCEAFMMIDIVKRGLRVERTGRHPVVALG